MTGCVELVAFYAACWWGGFFFMAYGNWSTDGNPRWLESIGVGLLLPFIPIFGWATIAMGWMLPVFAVGHLAIYGEWP